MHVNAKRLATAGLLVAFSVVLVLLASIIETSSLFFIVAASFCVGIAIREWGLLYGVGFYIASIGLNFLLAPNKMYCITFAVISLYIWMYEALWKWIAEHKTMKRRQLVLWIGKYFLFNVIYVPVLFEAPQLLFAGKVNGLFIMGMLLFGQVAFLVFDAAYRYFQSHVWGKLRGKLMK